MRPNYFIVLGLFLLLFLPSSTIASVFDEKKARIEYKELDRRNLTAFRRLLLKVPVQTALWLEMSSELATLTGGKLRQETLFSISGANHILSEDPFEPLTKIFYAEIEYQPHWEAVPMRSRLYAQNYARIQDFPKALHHVEKVMPEEPSNLHLVFTFVWLLEKSGYYPKAIQFLQAIKPEMVDFNTQMLQRKWLCRLYFRCGEYQKSEDMLGLLRTMQKRLVQENKEAWEKEKDQERKKKRETEYLQSFLEQAGVLNYLGLIFYLQEKRVLAFDVFEKVEKLFSGSFTYSFNKNKIFLESRKYETTLKNINEIIDNILALASFLGQKSLQALKQNDFLRATEYAQDRDYFHSIYSLLLTRKGEILFREKIYDKALATFQEATNRTPQDYVAWYRSGEILFLQQKYTHALQAFRKVVEFAPAEAQIHAEGLKRIDDVFNEEAVKAIAEQDKFSKTRDEFFQNLSVAQKEELLALKDIIMSGIRFLNEGRHKMVIEYFKRYMKDYPLVVEFPYYLGRAWQEMNNPHLAKFYYQKALELDGNHIPSLVGYLYFICIEHKFTEAEEILQKIEKIALDDHFALGSRGWYYYNRGLFDEALLEYQKAIEKEPSYGDHHYRLGMCYFRTGLYRFAAHKFADAISAGFVYSRAYLLQGLAYLKIGDSQKGELALKEAGVTGHDNPDITAFAKNVLRNIQRTKNFDWEKDTAAQEKLGMYLHFQTRDSSRRKIEFSVAKVISGRTVEVIQELQERLQKDPENSDLIFLLAYLHILTDREDIAEDYFYQLLDKNPYDYRALNSLSELSFRWGKIDQCLIYWDRMKRVSSLMRFSEALDQIADEFLRLAALNENDEWSVYHYALIKLHTRNELDALDILERINLANRDKNTDYKDKLLVLQGHILYKLGVLRNDAEFIKMSRGVLKDGNYRYLELIDRYKEGVANILPNSDVKPEPRIVPVPEEHVDFLKTELAIHGIKKDVSPTHPVRQLARPIHHWQNVDAVLARREPKKIKTSYDVFQEKRHPADERYYVVPRYTPKEEDSLILAKKENEEYAENLMQMALEHLKNGRWSEAEKKMLEVLNTLPDFTEAYFGTMLLYLMDGRFADILTLYPILYEFEEYRHFMLLLRSHIYFHQGDFNSALALLQELPAELVFPENRVYIFLFQVYRQIIELSPSDFEATFKLGLLLHITGRFADAERLYLRAGQYKGLIPYISETLAFKAIREKRMLPAKEAARRMFEISEIDQKDKWRELAKNLDKFIREYRFLAQ